MTSSKNVHPDQRYIGALLSDNGPLIREIYARYSAETIRWIAKNKGSADDADDIFQEALLAIMARAGKGGFALTCSFGAYFFLVIRGKWFNELKKRKLQAVTIEPWDGLSDVGIGEDAGKLAEETLLEHHRQKLFDEKLAALPERCRELLKLSWGGAPMDEVARQMGITYAYARKRKSECIASLVEAVQNDKEFLHLI
jgi:RNA polymerase sigma factor (sigma-70 family)